MKQKYEYIVHEFEKICNIPMSDIYAETIIEINDFFLFKYFMMI